ASWARAIVEMVSIQIASSKDVPFISHPALDQLGACFQALDWLVGSWRAFEFQGLYPIVHDFGRRPAIDLKDHFGTTPELGNKPNLVGRVWRADLKRPKR